MKRTVNVRCLIPLMGTELNSGLSSWWRHSARVYISAHIPRALTYSSLATRGNNPRYQDTLYSTYTFTFLFSSSSSWVIPFQRKDTNGNHIRRIRPAVYCLRRHLHALAHSAPAASARPVISLSDAPSLSRPEVVGASDRETFLRPPHSVALGREADKRRSVRADVADRDCRHDPVLSGFSD